MTIKDSIFAQAGGTVGRVFDTKNGRAFTLEVKDDRQKYPDRIAVWGAADNVNEGDRISVKGWLSWRREVKDDKTFFNVSMNAPQVVEHEPAQPQEESFPDDGEAPF